MSEDPAIIWYKKGGECSLRKRQEKKRDESNMWQMYAHLLQKTKMGIKEQIWSKIRQEEKRSSQFKRYTFLSLPAMLQTLMMQTHTNDVKALYEQLAKFILEVCLVYLYTVL